MNHSMRYSILLLLTISFVACDPVNKETALDKNKIEKEITEMFEQYHADIKRAGLTTEFKDLDDSDDFFWAPPGYSKALDYDSVRSILENNASMFTDIQFQFDTLKIYPLNPVLANYSGIISGYMTDTLGNTTKVLMLESGTLIKRQDGWKLLSGQSSNLSQDGGS